MQEGRRSDGDVCNTGVVAWQASIGHGYSISMHGDERWAGGLKKAGDERHARVRSLTALRCCRAPASGR